MAALAMSLLFHNFARQLVLNEIQLYFHRLTSLHVQNLLLVPEEKLEEKFKSSAWLQVFPRMANFTNTHKMTGVGNALKRHYQALCLDYELAHPEDLDKQVMLNAVALQIRIRNCLLAMGGLMGSEVQCW